MGSIARPTQPTAPMLLGDALSFIFWQKKWENYAGGKVPLGSGRVAKF